MRGAWHRVLVYLGLRTATDASPPARWRVWAVLICFGLAAGALLVDLVLDAPWRQGVIHMAWRVAILALACGAAASSVGELRERRGETCRLR